MKRGLLLAILTILAVLPGPFPAGPASAQTIPDGLYCGQTPPGLVPEVFAPEVISLSTRYEYSIAFSPDLTECVFGWTNNTWAIFNLLYTAMAPDSSWGDPVIAPFQGSGDALSPAFTADGQTVFFASMRPSYPPANIWRSDRDGMGGWTTPVKVPSPVSTGADEWAPCLTASDVLYFVSYRAGGLGSADIYRSVPVGGVYTTVQNIGAPVCSSSLDSTPFIAPDERYVLFESDRPGGYGQHDIYVSYALGGGWTAPINLGPDINTGDIEDGAYVTPDGRYLFFNRRAAYVTPQQTELWWVDVQAIPPNPTGVETGQLGPAREGALAQNAPNPFDPSTRIAYTLSASGFVTIEILDVRGRIVDRLVNRVQDSGPHAETLDAARTRGLAGGTYFYRLVVDGRTLETRRMVLAK